MAYNNNFYPATYQQPYQQMPQIQMPQMSMASHPRQSIQWVQGDVGARAYPVSPGDSVLLMDSDQSRFYIKSADSSGMPLPLRVFSYTEEVATQSHDMDTKNFVTKEEFNQWKEQMKKEKRNEQRS